jgi:hypothetical protein
LDADPCTGAPTLAELAGFLRGAGMWLGFVVRGAEAFADGLREYEDDFSMRAGETLAEVLDRYQRIAARTDEIVNSRPDLNMSHPLPPAAWQDPARQLVGAPGPASRERRDGPARGPRRHHSGDAGTVPGRWGEWLTAEGRGRGAGVGLRGGRSRRARR